MPRQDDPAGFAVSIGDVTDSAVAVGAGARANNTLRVVSSPADCTAALNELREQLRELHASGEAPPEAVDNALDRAEALSDELNRNNLKPRAILQRLGMLAVALDGLARTGDAMTHVVRAFGTLLGG
jgi:hypothetical protein